MPNMVSAAILLHRLPDGSAHFDLLIERRPAGASQSRRSDAASAWSPPTPADIDNPDERRLLAFRMDARLDEARLGDSLSALRLPDHRARYLAHEGPIAGDRGQASRVAVGRVVECAADEGRIELAIDWRSAGVRRVCGQRVADERWRLVVVA